METTEDFIIEDIKKAVAAERDRCASAVEAWLNMGEAKLRAGEMTAQEQRTLKAVLHSIVLSIRNPE
jgi:hypothetical protein